MRQFLAPHILTHQFISFSLFSLLRAAFVVCMSIGVVHANTQWQEERELYKKARKALVKKQINQFNQYSARLTEYPLFPYLNYEELKLRIASLSNQEVDVFIAANKESPLADRLRVAWLYQLQRKGRSESFLKYYQNDNAIALQCYFLRAKIRHNQFEENKKQYLNQARDLWLVGKSQPKQCDSLFDWYNQQGYLTTELIWERFALAMENNRLSLARYLAKKLPASEQEQAKLWLETYRNPKAKLLSNALQKDNHQNRQIIRHGMQRLARKDLSQAYERWLSIQDNYAFGSDLHDEVERNLALRAAYRHDERATTWMYQLPKDLVDPSTSMWRTRSALRSLDWELGATRNCNAK